MKALIVVDIQNDFLPEGRLAVSEGDKIISLVNTLQTKYDLVVATQDWHPANHRSFASQHPGKKVFEEIDLEGHPQMLWPDHCVQGSDGASFPNALDTRLVAAIFRKGMVENVDSYSGFYDNGRKQNTGLAGYLKDKNITEVHVCGLAADFCVFFTAMDSLAEGFKTGIILPATKAIDETSFERKKELFRQRGGLLL